MLNLTPVPDPWYSVTPALPYLMAGVIGTLVAFFTGDLRYALAVVVLIAAGGAVGGAIARRRAG